MLLVLGAYCAVLALVAASASVAATNVRKRSTVKVQPTSCVQVPCTMRMRCCAAYGDSAAYRNFLMQGKEQAEGTEAETTNLVHLKAHATAKKPPAAPATRIAPYALVSFAVILIMGLAAGAAFLFLSTSPLLHFVHGCAGVACMHACLRACVLFARHAAKQHA